MENVIQGARIKWVYTVTGASIPVENVIKDARIKWVYTVTEVAEMCGVSIYTVRRWCSRGMRCSHMGRRLLIQRKDLKKWLDVHAY